MQHNTIYHEVYRRKNVVADFVFGVFISLSSWPRLLIEILIRRNMGERYFKLSSATSIGLILLFYPIVSSLSFRGSVTGYHPSAGPSVLRVYWSWYVFLAAYAGCVYQRWLEQRRNPSIFNGGRCTSYSGDVHLLFFHLHPLGPRVSLRQVECIVEPSVFFLVGYLLNMTGQKVGVLFMICAVIYALSYVGLYRRGDNYIMDMLDDQVYSEQLEKVVMNDSPNNEKGVRIHGDKPTDQEGRKRLADTLNRQGKSVFFVE